MVCFGWLGYLWYVIYQLVLLGSCNAHWPRLYPKTYSAATDEEEEQRIWASKRGLSCSERTTTTERVVVVVGEKTTTKCICLCPAPCVWQKMICWRLWLPTKCTKHTTVITLRTTTMIAIRQAGRRAGKCVQNLSVVLVGEQNRGIKSVLHCSIAAAAIRPH